MPYWLKLRECQRANLSFVFCNGKTPQRYNFFVQQYTRHIFVVKDLPTCASYTTQPTAIDSLAIFPDKASSLLETIYTDIYLDSPEDPDVGFKLSREKITFLELGGLKIIKLISNMHKSITFLSPPESAPQHRSKIILYFGDS